MLQSIYDKELEYVNQYCLKYFSSIDVDPETGQQEILPSMIPELFLKRYNHFEMNEADFRNRYKDFTIPEGETFEDYKKAYRSKVHLPMRNIRKMKTFRNCFTTST